MGKIVGFLCLVTILFSLVGCQKNDTHGVYEVTITANQIFNHSIGNDWEKVYTCDGRVIGNRKCWTVPLDTEKTVTIHATITEHDQWSDIGQGSLSVVLRDGFVTSTIITVTENKGRYNGGQAKWEVVCQVKLVDKLKQE